MNGDSSCGSNTNGTPRSNWTNQLQALSFQSSKKAYLGNVIVLFVLFSIIVDQNASHSKVGYDRWVFLLNCIVSSWIKTRDVAHTEYSHSTKLLVSRKLKSPVPCSPSPTFPPFPSLRPALSFFFLAVRTFVKRSSILVGNWSAGRWKDRASCLDKRVLYWIYTQ